MGHLGRSTVETARPTTIPPHRSKTVVARIAGQILNELGEDAPEGGASLRTLNKKRFELERDELLDRTSPSLPKDFKLYHRDSAIGNSSHGFVRLVVRSPVAGTEDSDSFRRDRSPHPQAGRFRLRVHRALPPQGVHGRLCGAGLEYHWLIACVNDDTMGAIRSSGSILTFWRPVLLFQKPGGRTKRLRILRDLIHRAEKEVMSGSSRSTRRCCSSRL